ncbi:MAG: DegT/DnrJ/EryC1/StrS family aminotransferase, partial [Eubacteriales bacterium]
MDFLPYGKQYVDRDDIRAVREALTSDWLTTGPKVEEFEKDLARRAGARYAVAMNSGTAALHAAYFAAGVGPGDEVVTSPVTFAATANAALFLGAKPVFADVRRDTVNIDPADIGRHITARTRVLGPVDFAGHPADLDSIMDIAKRNGLAVVEDAAHALG